MATKTWIVSVTHWDRIASLTLDLLDTGDHETDKVAAQEKCKEVLSEHLCQLYRDQVRFGPVDPELDTEARARCGQFDYDASLAEKVARLVPGIERHFEDWRTPRMPRCAADDVVY